MTKTLSEQLCEICGIKPYNYLVDYAGNYEPFETLDEAEKFSKKHGNAPLELNYYDFENPKNFMKLLEIVSKKASVSFCHNGTYYGCSIHYFFKDIFEAVEGTLQHNFLNTLLVQDLRNPCKPKLLEQIKQDIRQAYWEM